MFDFLPPQDVGDPEAFQAAAIAILASYPEEVAWAVVDPVSGLPGRVDRLTLKAVRDACEARQWTISWDLRTQKQLEERRAAEARAIARGPSKFITQRAG